MSDETETVELPPIVWELKRSRVAEHAPQLCAMALFDESPFREEDPDLLVFREGWELVMAAQFSGALIFIADHGLFAPEFTEDVARLLIHEARNPPPVAAASSDTLPPEAPPDDDEWPDEPQDE